MEGLPDPNDIKPGWTNGEIILLSPVERGWIAVVKSEVKLELVEEEQGD